MMITSSSLLNPDAFLSPLAIDEAATRALDEDLGRGGDVTSIATIPEATTAHAVMVARQAGRIAGLPLAVATLQKLAPNIRIEAHARDSATVAAGSYQGKLVLFFSDVPSEPGTQWTLQTLRAPVEEVQLFVRDASGKRTDVSLPELIAKSMGGKIARADLHISQSADGELFVTSRQDGWIRMLVP